MNAHASRLTLVVVVLCSLIGCKPQFGNVVATNGTDRTLTEITIEVPNVHSPINSQAGATFIGELKPGDSKPRRIKGLLSGAVVVSWIEPDGKSKTANGSLGNTEVASIELVIENDGSITVKN